MAQKLTELRAGMSQAARDKSDGMARQMLVSLVPTGAPGPDLQDEADNPVMQTFLSLLEGQMAAHPELIEPVTEAQMACIAALVDEGTPRN
jgi:hypothetical protein